MRGLQFYINRSLVITEVIVILLLLIWRFKLGLTRYVDIDEFAHLHWSYNFFSGMRPYSDFLYFFPPGFLYTLAPLFLLVGKTSYILIAGRTAEFVIFLLLLGTTFLLVRKVRDSQTALLTILVLSFLPIPYDKFLEIRPDTLATLFALVGVYFLSCGLLNQLKPKNWRNLSLAGFFYGLSLFTLPKVVFFLIAAFVILLIAAIRRPTSVKNLILPFLLGILILGVFCLLFFVWSGDVGRAIYLTTKFASDSSKVLGRKFYMFPSHFFHPNDTYYALPGVSTPLVANLIIYIIGCIWGIISFVSFLGRKTWEESLVQLLLSLTFLINLIAFIKLIPLKHAQYFISFAPFVVFYFAEFVYSIQNLLARRKVIWIFSILMAGLIIFIGVTGHRMYQIKIKWTNLKTLVDLDLIYKTIPEGEYVFDLIGATIFYKDPYFVCCLPYGQYEEAFSFRLPSLARSLIDTQTKYVFPYFDGRLSVLPPQDERFIRSNYTTLLADPMLMVAK